MDEPTSALDLAHQITVLDLARTHADTSTDRPGGGAVIVGASSTISTSPPGSATGWCCSTRAASSRPAPRPRSSPPTGSPRVYGIGVRTSRDPATGAVRVTALSPSLAGAS